MPPPTLVTGVGAHGKDTQILPELPLEGAGGGVRAAVLGGLARPGGGGHTQRIEPRDVRRERERQGVRVDERAWQHAAGRRAGEPPDDASQGSRSARSEGADLDRVREPGRAYDAARK